MGCDDGGKEADRALVRLPVGHFCGLEVGISRNERVSKCIEAKRKLQDVRSNTEEVNLKVNCV